MTTTADADLDEVRVFWEAHPCGSDTAQSIDRLEYFLGIEQYRYSLLRFIPSVARFESFAGKRVLEIGCGVGTDGTRFARGGASYTGTDLTEAAIALARENFALRGLQGSFMTANAEALPFDDSSYDHVYCFGVIHHTPQPDAIVREIRRVLVPGGTVTVMLYNRSSINYYVEIMGVRKIGRLLLRPAWAPKLLSAAFRLRRDKLEGHRANLLRVPHPTREQWISMNTDWT